VQRSSSDAVLAVDVSAVTIVGTVERIV